MEPDLYNVPIRRETTLILSDVEVLLSTDPEQILGWAADCLEKRLYRTDGIAQHLFAGEGRIVAMAYIPGVAWSMYSERPKRYRPLPGRLIGQVFVDPPRRHKGIGMAIGYAMHAFWNPSMLAPKTDD